MGSSVTQPRNYLSYLIAVVIAEVEHVEQIPDCRHVGWHIGVIEVHLRIGQVVSAARGELAKVPVALNELHE